MSNPTYKPETPSAWTGFKQEIARCSRCQEVLITHIRRRDWGQIIGALSANGVTHREIARRVGVSVSTVQNWMNGEPKESDARKVLALYRRHVGEI